MYPYRKIKSSWVDGFGYDNGVLYVGTQGKYYEVTGLNGQQLDTLLDAVKSDKSVGSVVGKLFKAGTTVPVDWDTVVTKVGSDVSGQPQSGTGKAMQNLRKTFADLLLPHARTGLFAVLQ